MCPLTNGGASQTWGVSLDCSENGSRDIEEKDVIVRGGAWRFSKMPRPIDDIILDHKEFAYLTGKTFRGLTISQNGEAFRIILRAFGDDREPLYCICEHDDVRQGVLVLLDALGKRGGAELWRRDKFYKGSA